MTRLNAHRGSNAHTADEGKLLLPMCWKVSEELVQLYVSRASHASCPQTALGRDLILQQHAIRYGGLCTSESSTFDGGSDAAAEANGNLFLMYCGVPCSGYARGTSPW